MAVLLLGGLRRGRRARGRGGLLIFMMIPLGRIGRTPMVFALRWLRRSVVILALGWLRRIVMILALGWLRRILRGLNLCRPGCRGRLLNLRLARLRCIHRLIRSAGAGSIRRLVRDRDLVRKPWRALDHRADGLKVSPIQ